MNPILPVFALALFCFAFPNLAFLPVIRQTPLLLQAALFLFRFQWAAELLCCCVALGLLARRFLAARLVEAAGGFKRSGLILGTFGVLACAAVSRVNVFELLFHPAGAPAFQPVSESRLDPDQKLLTVSLGREARAYPIRNIAYNHIVNDVMAGIPIVVTY